MSVTEYERHQLFSWFEEHMGADRAATMMNLIPPVGWADIATKHDLAQLEDRLTTRFDVLESRFDSKLDRLRSDMQRTFVTWLFLSQGAVIAAIGVLLAVLR
jgi:hypothetical protein